MISWIDEQRANHAKAIINMMHIQDTTDVRHIRDTAIEAEENVRKNLEWLNSLSDEEIEEFEKAAKAEEAQG